ncbi:MAG: trypsin-like peptidase domain-containing protein, partial [Rhodopirellula sp.]|nr:trypsin-like peptidase domain-containing protein [Rhodopirellula sp.]
LETIPFGGFFEDDELDTEDEDSAPGLGCGVIIDPSGIVLTNYHVTEEVGELFVELSDGRQFKVKDIRKDKRADLALLILDCTELLPAAELGDSDNLRIGDWVLTIGSPFELAQTVSAGIVSGKGRIVRGAGKTRLLQTDAAINPGSSGGALVNLRGEVVGITTAIASRDGGYQGVGFAIPINLAKWVSTQLREHGRVRRGYLGATFDGRSSNLTSPGGGVKYGALVSEVAIDSPARRAGLRMKDKVISFDGQPVSSTPVLLELIERSEIGSTHRLEVLRGGTQKILEVAIEESSSMAEALSSAQAEFNEPPELVYSRDLEVAVGDLSRRIASQLGVQTGEGVVVVRLDRGGAAFRAGIRGGMVIVRAGNRQVRNTEDFADIMERESLTRGIRLQIFTGKGTQTITVRSP